MASSDAGAHSSTSISSLGVPWALKGGSSGSEALLRCLHVGEGDLRPIASPRPSLFLGQVLAYAKRGPLQFPHLTTVCLH